MMFETAAPIYREALAKSGYKCELKFDPNAAKPGKKNRNRKRNISWFNPPHNATVKTNVGAEFLKLVDRCFPHSNPLSKIINRNTVKVSYSCTRNMEAIISGKNAKILASTTPENRTCSCPRNVTCPLQGKCLTKNLVYHTKVTQEDQTTNDYIGLTSTDFKARLAVHKRSFINEEENQTSLSKHIWELKRKNINYTLNWELVDRAMPFSPVTGVCWLCIKEKFHIMFRPSMANLNSRSEIYSNCRHKKSALLIPPIRKKKKRTPG